MAAIDYRHDYVTTRHGYEYATMRMGRRRKKAEVITLNTPDKWSDKGEASTDWLEKEGFIIDEVYRTYVHPTRGCEAVFWCSSDGERRVGFMILFPLKGHKFRSHIKWRKLERKEAQRREKEAQRRELEVEEAAQKRAKLTSYTHDPALIVVVIFGACIATLLIVGYFSG